MGRLLPPVRHAGALGKRKGSDMGSTVGSAGHCFAQGLPVYFLMLDALHADPRGLGKSWWTDKNPQILPRSSSPYDSRWRAGSPEERRLASHHQGSRKPGGT